MAQKWGDAILVDGKWLKECRGDIFEVSNPATGECLGQLPCAGQEETAKAIGAAKKAFGHWAEKTAWERAEVLKKLNTLMLERIEDLARTITLENGKPLEEARGEVRYAAGFVEWFAEEGKRAYGRICPASARGRKIEVAQYPVGVVASVIPWNFPLAMAARKTAPALAAGCTCVLKPSELTPFSALAYARLAAEAGVPSGVLNVVFGKAPEIGEVMTSNPTVRHFSFTGSTEVGKLLAKKAGAHLKRCSFELGGNAPFIVFDDADIAKAVDAAMVAKYRNGGQSCIAANRFYLSKKTANEFEERLLDKVRLLKEGDGMKGADVGPLIDLNGLEKIKRHVRDALDKGGSLLLGGEPSDLGGLFYQPTVIKGLKRDMLAYQEETFGPVVMLGEFEDEEKLIDEANGSEMGLAAYVMTPDASRMERLSKRLEFGVLSFNSGLPSTPEAPFGGMKMSGYGKEGASEGLEEFLEKKYLCRDE